MGEYILLQQTDLKSMYKGAFSDLRESGELFDVTLACENSTIQAHKVILSACSTFFRTVLGNTKHDSQPYIYLKGTKQEDLMAILNYIYNGETQIESKTLPSFLATAKDLEIKGLTTDNTEKVTKEPEPSCSKETENKKKDKSPFDATNGYQQHQSTDENNALVGNNEDIANNDEIAENNFPEIVDCDLVSYDNNGYDDSIDDYQINALEDTRSAADHETSLLKIEISKRMESYLDPEGKLKWRCTVCGKGNKQKTKLALHVETHIEGFSHTCELCQREYKTKNSLFTHLYTVHKEQLEKNTYT